MRTNIVSVLLMLIILIACHSVRSDDCGSAMKNIKNAISQPENTQGYLKKVELYKQAIESCPNSVEAHNNIADAYENQGRFEEAIKEYKRAIEIDKSFSMAYFGLGDVYLKTNRQKEAAEWYKKGLEIEPDDMLTQERLAKAEAISNELNKSGIITADSIKRLLTSRTRALGEVVSIQFDEELIPFDYDKSEIRQDAKPQLNELGKALQSIVGTKDISVEGIGGTILEISGHTDSRGADSYNSTLSEKRAVAVVKYLIENFNIPDERLRAKGYGETLPLCAEESESCYALNRRVEVAVITDAASTRSFRSVGGETLNFEIGFFHKSAGEEKVNILSDEQTILKTSDQVFLFFRPHQNSYVYILNEDDAGTLTLLYPVNNGSAQVIKGHDYWIPGFGKAYTIQGPASRETIYFIATSWPLTTSEGELTAKLIKEAANGLRSQPTRAILPVSVNSEASGVGGTPSSGIQEASSGSSNLDSLLQTIEGQGGWVKAVRFIHN